MSLDNNCLTWALVTGNNTS